VPTLVSKEEPAARVSGGDRSMSGAVSDRAIKIDEPVAQWRGPAVAAGVLVALMTLLFWEFFRRQVLWAIREPADWGHTLVIPFLAAYLVYFNREKLLARPFRTAWIGFLPIVVGIGWYTLCSIGPQPVQHHNLQGAGVALTITGVVLLFCGFRAMLWLWLPLLFLFVFGQTISERFMQIVTFKLQDIAARGSHIALILLGVDVERTGNTLYVMKGGTPIPLNIAEACSGMRMLMAFLALGVVMGYVGLKRNWQRIVLFLLGVPTAVFVNILRVVTLSILALLDTGFAAGDFHTFIGLIWLIPAFLIYLGIMWILRNVIVEPEDEST
jgi:exosortase